MRLPVLQKIKDNLGVIERIEGRTGADTIKLWERYREQALLWRTVAILQIPITILALIGFLIVFATADVSIEPPEMPQPGIYSVKYLPDSEFLKVATEVINLIATYQSATAEKQFNKAREYLWEPALTEFEDTMIKEELVAIKQNNRSQVFLINNELVRVQRFPARDIVVVRLPGSQFRTVSNTREAGTKEIAYYVKMSTIPRSAYNESGIVILDIRLKDQTTEDLKQLDSQERKLN